MEKVTKADRGRPDVSKLRRAKGVIVHRRPADAPKEFQPTLAVRRGVSLSELRGRDGESEEAGSESADRQ